MPDNRTILYITLSKVYLFKKFLTLIQFIVAFITKVPERLVLSSSSLIYFSEALGGERGGGQTSGLSAQTSGLQLFKLFIFIEFQSVRYYSKF